MEECSKVCKGSECGLTVIDTLMSLSEISETLPLLLLLLLLLLNLALPLPLSLSHALPH